MAALQKLPQSSSNTTASSFGSSCKPDVGVSDQFPAGLRVLVVDDDVTCLRILEQMLRRCMYHVTTCSQATVALNLLRERKGCFDVVLSDVHMPDMDGFKLLELVGLEMDLPVIMMSADGRTNLVLKGIRHGACDYLIKPMREEELKNIWQHVVRKKWSGNKEHEHSGSLDENDRHKRGSDEAEYASSVNEGTEGMPKPQKKRRDVKEEDDCELENDDAGASKKPRVVWSVELHQQFVSAVNQLGIDKAVPKRILELMNMPGLTRENVASHLQKFRLYLKRLSGVAQQQGTPNSFCGPVEQKPKVAAYGRFDIQALAASGQIPPQTLAALHSELLGRPTSNLRLPVMDQPALLQVSLQGSKCITVDPGVQYSQPLMKSPSNISKQFCQPIISDEDARSGFGSWPSENLGTPGPGSNIRGMGVQNCNILIGRSQHQQHQQQEQQKQVISPEPSRSINVQPSCLVVPSQASGSLHAWTSSGSVNQSNSLNSSSIIDYNLLVTQSDNPSCGVGQMSNGNLKTIDAPSECSRMTSPSVFCCSVDAEFGGARQVHNSIPTFSPCKQLPGTVPATVDNQTSFSNSSEVLDQGQLRNLGFVGKGTSIPSRFAVYETESPTSNLGHGETYLESSGRQVKQEPDMDFIDNSKMGNPTLQHFSPNDLMSVFSE